MLEGNLGKFSCSPCPQGPRTLPNRPRLSSCNSLLPTSKNYICKIVLLQQKSLLPAIKREFLFIYFLFALKLTFHQRAKLLQEPNRQRALIFIHSFRLICNLQNNLALSVYYVVVFQIIVWKSTQMFCIISNITYQTIYMRPIWTQEIKNANSIRVLYWCCWYMCFRICDQEDLK